MGELTGLRNGSGLVFCGAVQLRINDNLRQALSNPVGRYKRGCLTSLTGGN
jgi:hypothetical protein